jgi:isopentenyl diphosphate isomerase/L-lactate dehydrogenase-like FMN-dependent dehydrogenase
MVVVVAEQGSGRREAQQVADGSGRALDTAPPALYTLLEINKICPEVLKKCEVYIDGGVRRGTDVVKAVCLGAKGVGLGRPFLYSLTYGKEGVIHGIESESHSVGFPILQAPDHPPRLRLSECQEVIAHGQFCVMRLRRRCAC